MNEQLYKLSCPSCGNIDLLVREDDMEEDEFVEADPVVWCLACGLTFNLSKSKLVECSEGQTLHMLLGDGP